MSNLRVFECFSGYGSQSIALNNIGVDHKVVAISEIDPDVIIAYGSLRFDLDSIEVNKSIEDMKSELMNKRVGWDFKKQKSSIPRMNKDKLKKLYIADSLSKNLGDVSTIKVDDIPEHDLFTYSFPCQDISVAGKQKGIEKGETRSGLLYECEKIIEHHKPKYLLMENVKNLVGKKFISQFNEWLDYLEGLGYKNYWKVINSKDCGVPQARDRVFVVSILNDEKGFKFEESKELDITLVDILEDRVDERYYINTERADIVIKTLLETNQINNDVVPCDSTMMKPKALTVANCITARYDAGIQNKQSIGVAVVERIKNYDNSIRLGGLFDDDKKHQAGSIWDTNALAPTLDTMQGGYRQPCIIDEVDNFRLRKLTCRECFRLMGLNEEQIDRIQASGISNSQQYKMAGNSIVVQVLEGIFRQMLKDRE